MKRVLALAACWLMAVTACDRGSEPPKADPGVPRTVARDTTRVFTRGDGVWGPAHDAMEVLRVPSDTKETTFGLVRDVAARPDGGVLVFDVKGAEGLVLRAFDANGRFERNIGRAGNGPGEYSSDAMHYAVQPDGIILLREARRAVTRYGADGRFLGGYTVLPGPGRADIMVGQNGTFYTTAALDSPSGLTRGSSSTRGQARPLTPARLLPVFHYDSAGRLLDSIVLTQQWLVSDAAPYGFAQRPSQSWVPLPDGRIVVSRTDKLGFLLVDPASRRPPLLSEVPTAPVRYLDEERKALQAAENASGMIEGGRRIAGGVPTTVPEFKVPAQPAFVDVSGRIWIRKSVASQRVDPYCMSARSDFRGDTCLLKGNYYDPPVFVAFQVDGTYLGEVRFPLRSRMMAFVGDFAWGIVRSADDEQLLVKYRIHK
jgi:hypothetical protein